MKLLIRDYLASLKERNELDAILPDLLSELGFTVISRPGRGTSQHGVDIAAVGEDEDGERKIFLFSLKQGDVTRQDWDGNPQAIRASLNEIRDAYIRNRIPVRYQTLRIVICLAFGGDLQEQVRDSWGGYTRENTTDRIAFEEWNGDKIAGLILKGILREEILPNDLRSSFRKAVAMVDEPDVSFAHFLRLTEGLHRAGDISNKAKVRSARQLNICLWILFVWARDAGNLEAPYRASEIGLLKMWDLLRPGIGKKSKDATDLANSFIKLIQLHLTIASELIEKKVLPHANVRHGFSRAIKARDSLDVNLACFEVLGRIGLTGLWLHWLLDRSGKKGDDEMRQGVVNFVRAGFDLIQNNPTLYSPRADRQGTDIALFLLLWMHSGQGAEEVVSWLSEMANRITFAVQSRGLYPLSSADYRDLSAHPRERSDEYFKETTCGSAMLPLITAWLEAFRQDDVVKKISALAQKELEHCTFQLWMPDSNSETELFSGMLGHGKAVFDLPLCEGGRRLLTTIAEACRTDTDFPKISAVKTGFWPLVLTACHHSRFPIPPQFWIQALKPPGE